MLGEVVLSEGPIGEKLKPGDQLSFVVDTENASEHEKKFLSNYYKPGIWMIFQISKDIFAGITINTANQEDCQFRITGIVVKVVLYQP